MAALAGIPAVPEATTVRALSAQLRRPQLRSAMSALRRHETSLLCLKCANSGHSRTVQRTGQVDPERKFPEAAEMSAWRRERPFAKQVAGVSRPGAPLVLRPGERI